MSDTESVVFELRGQSKLSKIDHRILALRTDGSVEFGSEAFGRFEPHITINRIYNVLRERERRINELERLVADLQKALRAAP